MCKNQLRIHNFLNPNVFQATTHFHLWRKGPSINDVGNWEGGGVKNWSKLPTDSTKKLPTWRRGVSKIRKNCRRHLWMVPYAFLNLCKSKTNSLRDSSFPDFFFSGMKFRQNKQEQVELHCN